MELSFSPELNSAAQYVTAYVGERPFATLQRRRHDERGPVWRLFDTEGRQIGAVFSGGRAGELFAALRTFDLAEKLFGKGAITAPDIVEEAKAAREARRAAAEQAEPPFDAQPEEPAPAVVTLAETRQIVFHVRSNPAFVTKGKRYAITTGRYNFALCDEDGAIIRTFVPDTDSVADIMRALNPALDIYLPCEDAAQYVAAQAGDDETPLSGLVEFEPISGR